MPNSSSTSDRKSSSQDIPLAPSVANGTWVAAFFALVALSLFAAIASNEYIPAGDFRTHTSELISAKLAIDEHQFPIRVGPWLANSLRYADFQFYGQTPFFAGGLIYKLFPQLNPYFILKFVIWLALTIGGIYMYRSALLITRSRPASLLAGAVYLLTPYVIININIRGDFCEPVAQGLIPVVLYYTLLICFAPAKGQWINHVLGSVAWYLLITTHLITFVYFALFLAILLLIMAVLSPSRWKSVLLCAVPVAASIMLSVWYLVPIAKSSYLHVHNYLDGDHATWLTPLPGLLSFASVCPMPLPGNGLLTAPLHPAIGWPILAAAIYSLYALMKRPVFHSGELSKALILPLILAFVLAFFATWSPVNFWPHLPRYLNIIQYSLRLLAQISWLGALLAGWAVVSLCRNLVDGRHVVAGLLLISACISSWMTTVPSIPLSVDALTQNSLSSRDSGYEFIAYVANPAKIDFVRDPNNQLLPFRYVDGWLNTSTTIAMDLGAIRGGQDPVLRVEGSVPQSYFPHNVNLVFRLGSSTVRRECTLGESFVWEIHLTEMLKGQAGSELAASFSTDVSFVPKERIPGADDTRALAFRLDRLQLLNLSQSASFLPLEMATQSMSRHGDRLSFHLIVPSSVTFVPLPVLYYPDLLDLKVDGQVVPYRATGHKNYSIVALQMSPGDHTIKVRFRGVVWANLVSSLAWIAVAGTVIFGFASRLASRKTNPA